MDLSQSLERYRSGIEAELKSLINNMASPLYHMMRYHLGWVDERGKPVSAPRGKMLRPALCLLACDGVGGDWREALPAAAAVELVHDFSLAHDDVEDRSPERWGRPTLWQIWGEAQAINTGDTMLALSRLALRQLRERGVGGDKMLQAAYFLDEACLRLCEGQHLDLCYENRLDIGVADYLTMIGNKTAALFECSLKLGALLGADDPHLVERLGRFGHSLGLAYQIRDDILGIWGQEKVTGKSSVSDIQGVKKTLPVIYGLGEREELRHIYQKSKISPDDVTRVLWLLDAVGARGYAQGMAQQYYEQAVSELGSASISSQAKKKLEMIAIFVTEREY